MTSKSVPVRTPANPLELVDLYSRDQRTDRSVTLRQWLYQAAEVYAVKLVGEGRLSIGRAAELLDMTHHDVYRLAEDHGIELGATEEQHRQSREHARLLRPR